MNTQQSLPYWSGVGKHRGLWWAADKPEFAFRGTLRFDKRRPRLTLLSPPIGQDYYHLADAGTLHGRLDNGQFVTLWDPQLNPLIHLRGRRHHDQTRTRRVFAYAIRGAHLGSYEESTFSISAFVLRGLKSWSQINATPADGGSQAGEHEATPPATVVGLHAEEFGVEYTVTQIIEFPTRIEHKEGASRGATLTQSGDDVRVVFEVSPPAPAAYHHYLLADFQTLLTFSMQTGAPVEGAWFANSGDALMPFFRRDEFSGNPPRTLHQSQMVLSAAVVDVATLTDRWWWAVENLFPAPQVVAQYHHAGRGVLEGSTTSVIAAIERLHETIGAQTHRFEPGYLETRLAEVLASYADKSFAPFRSFLRDSFQNNRPVLRTRLGDIVNYLGADRLRLAAIDADDWVEGVKSVRDKLAHGGAHVDHRNQGASNLLDLVNVQSRAVLTLLLLKLMGFSANVIDAAARVLADDVKRFASSKS